MLRRFSAFLCSVSLASTARAASPPLADLPLAPSRGALVTRLAPCHLKGLAEAASCTRYDVPEDRSTPGSRRISLAVAVVPALRRHAAKDPLVLLAGGPGQGALSLAPLVSRFRGVRKGRDLVLVDLRGTGSSNALRCPVPSDDLGGLSTGAPTAVDARACAAALTSDPSLYTTEQQALDLDEVRSALGYDQVNLWGGSWGTRTALVYATLFPGRTRSVVLDGAAPFELAFPGSVAEDAQRALDLTLDACAGDEACRTAFPDVKGDLARLLDRTARLPIQATIPHPRTGSPHEIVVTRDAFASGLRGILYTAEGASLLPLVVSEAARGRFAPFAAQVAATLDWSTDTMALGLTLSILCAEDVPHAARNAADRATFLGDGFASAWRSMCQAWPVRPVEREGASGPLANPALVLSGDLDPVTPPRWGEAMARRFRRGSHVVVPGTSHNVSFTGCVPELIARFVADGSAASLDPSCVSRVARPPFVVAGAAR